VVEAGKKRVLVIDDAGLVRMYYRDALERAGYEVDEALNGLEAIEKLLARPADLQMDGLTFLQVLRRHDPPVGAIPALVASTEAGPQDAAAARTAGANFYLVKPLTALLLVRYVGLLCGAPA
jgi:two-component system chemotaxis response regulator CheY